MKTKGLRVKTIHAAVLLWALILPSASFAAATFTIGQPDEEVFYGKFEGFGAEWDPFFWNAFHQEQGLNQADWDLITGRIRDMQVPFTRMYTQLYFATFDPDLQVWNYDNQRMQSLFKYLDFACQNNMYVMLDEWNYAFWQNYEGDPLAPEYAEGVAEFLKEIVVNRGYSCVKYLLVANEPDYEFYHSFSFSTFSQMIQNIDQALKANGMRDRIMFVGPGEACCGSVVVPAMQSPLHAVYDGYDRHGYMNSSQVAQGIWWEIEQYRERYVKELSPEPETDLLKPQFITEAGIFDTSNDSFGYALDMADYGTTVLNTTINGAVAWYMHDIYHDFGRSEWSDNEMLDNGRWGLWKYKDQDWALRPWSQTWGLLTRFSPRGSSKAPVSYPGSAGYTPPENPPTSSVRVGALKRADNGWSFFLVNRNSSLTSVQLNLPDTDLHELDMYVVDADSLTTYPDQVIIPPVGSLSGIGTIAVDLPGQSFTVLVETGALCTPDCTDRVCGSSSCGGSCGSCPAGSTCNTDQTECVDVEAPTIPGSLVASHVETFTATLSWSPASDNVGVLGYHVFRDGFKIATVSETSYTDQPLASSSLYSYRVSAEDQAGNVGVLSTPLTVTTAGDPSSPYCIPSDPAPCGPPVGEWRFDEGAGLDVYDASGNVNNASMGFEWSGWNTGRFDTAAEFDGTDGHYVRIFSRIMPPAAYTKSAWVFWRGGDRGNIMSSGLGGVNHAFGVLSGAFGGNCSSVAQRLAAGHNGDYCSAFDSIVFPTDQWIHVAVTYDAEFGGGTLRLYRNGMQVASANNIRPITDDPFLNIGAWGWWSVWNGLIDQARLYNYARTMDQINLDMNYNPTGPCVPSCSGKVCGTDGCGGTCGSCSLGEMCSPDQTSCNASPQTPAPPRNLRLIN